MSPAIDHGIVPRVAGSGKASGKRRFTSTCRSDKTQSFIAAMAAGAGAQWRSRGPPALLAQMLEALGADVPQLFQRAVEIGALRLQVLDRRSTPASSICVCAICVGSAS